MAAPKFLTVSLKLMALYAGVIGSLVLMFQDVAEFFFGYPIKDPVVARYWGGVLIVLAVLYLFLSTDPEKYRLFLWVGVFDLSIALIVTIINMTTNAITVTQGMIAIIINPIFIILLLYGLAKEPKSEVVFFVQG
ncbi:MAG: hypothetical protein ABIA62_04395, partial [Candidatus Woesearchaeota archaeon]